MTHVDGTRITVRSAADLLAAVPYLIGFHPVDSLVAVGTDRGILAFAARVDLPPAGAGPIAVGTVARYLAAVIARQRVGAVTLVGYGSPDRVDGPLRGTADVLAADRHTVYDLLRVTDGRYWSYICDNPSCCPPEGTPFDVSTSPVAATFAFAGDVALPDREALVRRLAPVGGLTRISMRQATVRAEAQVLELLESATAGLEAAALAAAGEAAVRSAITRCRAGDRLSDDEVAWLTMLLATVQVRDIAWQSIDEPGSHMALWTEVVRRAEPDLVAGPASLLAFAAWRAGQGALAAVAVDRALRADPGYALALLIDEALRNALPPSTVDGWPDLSRTGRRRSSGGRKRARKR